MHQLRQHPLRQHQLRWYQWSPIHAMMECVELEKVVMGGLEQLNALLTVMEGQVGNPVTVTVL